jgi:hypothetical protein
MVVGSARGPDKKIPSLQVSGMTTFCPGHHLQRLTVKMLWSLGYVVGKTKPENNLILLLALFCSPG